MEELDGRVVMTFPGTGSREWTVRRPTSDTSRLNDPMWQLEQLRTRIRELKAGHYFTPPVHRLFRILEAIDPDSHVSQPFKQAWDGSSSCISAIWGRWGIGFFGHHLQEYLFPKGHPTTRDMREIGFLRYVTFWLVSVSSGADA